MFPGTNERLSISSVPLNARTLCSHLSLLLSANVVAKSAPCGYKTTRSAFRPKPCELVLRDTGLAVHVCGQ